MVPQSYAQLHRYDGAAIERGRRGDILPRAIQPRDLQLLASVRSHRFLTTDQLLELFWPHAKPQAGRLRLRKLFDAGCLERFRPVARRGSFPWTFHLGRQGHRSCRRRASPRPASATSSARSTTTAASCTTSSSTAGCSPTGASSATRYCAGKARSTSSRRNTPAPCSCASTTTGRPRAAPAQAAAAAPRRAARTAAPRWRLAPFLVEHDRTRRVDKNYDKFRGYDSFLCWCGATTPPGPTAPKPRSCCSFAKTRINATCFWPPPTANYAAISGIPLGDPSGTSTSAAGACCSPASSTCTPSAPRPGDCPACPQEIPAAATAKATYAL
jgi:Replication-relaxation